jgi:nucleotide-binding universal stress UspA family protein
MEKVLLAIDGITPNKKAVRYAVELCRHLKADLSVLQVIGQKYMKSLGERVNRARTYVEDSMIAATFAEAGEHEMAKAIKEQALNKINRLLPDSESDVIHCHLSIRSGQAEKEILHYVNDHRDIVLTIYDAPEQDMNDIRTEPKERHVPMRIRRQLSTPLVVFKR